ncbi:heparanase-like [Patella vulgata]|uniref:heparanase-like n=1 Tax=Patella vulgata TaxID=6465 RepID=UPI0024A8A1C4|nr:heparanase-like [Patella vulgata]
MTSISVRLKNLAKALGPSYLRVSGTAVDYTLFDEVKSGNRIFKKETFDGLNNLVKEAGWGLIFGVNLQHRTNGRWDPSNALKLFQYTIEKGYHVAEPGQYYKRNETLAPDVISRDYDRIKTVLDSIPAMKPYLLIGPDVGAIKALEPIMKAGAYHSLDVMTYHQYYVHGDTAKVENFYNIHVIESVKFVSQMALDISHRNGGKPVWLGETSSASGGGAKGISDRYVAGFLWLDKLGKLATMGVKGVFRQELAGGIYTLLDTDWRPRPDYWLTVLYKRLVGTVVLSPPTPPPYSRVFVQCTNRANTYGYNPGSVTVMVLNLRDTNMNFKLGSMADKMVELYMLTPGSQDGLLSKTVKLNGKELFLVNDEKLPPLLPRKQKGDWIAVAAHSFGFIVIPDANHRDCL